MDQEVIKEKQKPTSFNELSEGESLSKGALVRFVKGTAVGLLASSVLQPLQVIKVSMQITPIHRLDRLDLESDKFLERKELLKKAKQNNKLDCMTFREATKHIFVNEGPKGFIRGLVPSLIKNGVMTGQYFSILFYLEHMLSQANVMSQNKNQAVSAALTKTIQSIISNPIIVVKTRFEVAGFNEYDNTMDAFRKIYMKEGGAAFFTGLQVSLVRDVPFSGLFYPIYSFFRKELLQLYEYEMSGSVNQSQRMKAILMIASISSLMANIVACTITNPLDLIRTRAYFKFHNKDEQQHYKGIYHAMQKIYYRDGVMGYFNGLFPRICRKGFGSIVVWTSYEYLIDKKDSVIQIA